MNSVGINLQIFVTAICIGTMGILADGMTTMQRRPGTMKVKQPLCPCHSGRKETSRLWQRVVQVS